MNAVISSIYSIDTDGFLADSWPENPLDFGMTVRMLVGPLGSHVEESFDVFVCTPEWLARECRREGSSWGLHKLIVAEFDPDRIAQEMHRVCRRCSGQDWATIARKIARVGAWEFDGYAEGES